MYYYQPSATSAPTNSSSNSLPQPPYVSTRSTEHLLRTTAPFSNVGGYSGSDLGRVGAYTTLPRGRRDRRRYSVDVSGIGNSNGSGSNNNSSCASLPPRR